MEVLVKKKALKKFLNKVLFEQAVDMSSAGSPDPEGDFESTVPSNLPIAASEEMATQLSEDRPPVEDEDFVPSSAVELGRAADVIARMVPQDQIEYFYRNLKLVFESAIERNNNPETIEIEEQQEEVVELEKNEAKIILSDLMTILKEQMSLDLDSSEYDSYRGIDFFGDDDDEEEALGLDTSKSGASLEDLASKFGYSSPSGVRQDIERILKRLGYSVENLSDEDIDAVRSYARDEYIDLFDKLELTDEEGIKLLKANPYQHVDNSDSFRFFLVSGFILPAYQKIVRDARKRVESDIEALGVPQRTKQTILNQAMGDTPRNLKKLTKKLERDAAAEGLNTEDIASITSDVVAAMPSLMKSAEIEGDLAQGAMDIWSRAGIGKKKKIIRQAMDQTSEFQEGDDSTP